MVRARLLLHPDSTWVSKLCIWFLRPAHGLRVLYTGEMILFTIGRATHSADECFRASLSWLRAEDVVLEEPWLLNQKVVAVALP